MSIRTGIGYDVHKLVRGRPLMLGGVRFESETGLEGHSDADVLCHAIGDALLGALSLGDLGTHFPPDDPRWKDASSLDLLRRIRVLVEGAEGRIVHVDSSLVCEAPKIAPMREAMSRAIAEALGVSAGQVSIKATTNEGLGFLGRGEGIAALAIATVAPGAGSRIRGSAEDLSL